MRFEENFTYHVYNRSNQTIFATRENYVYFLKKFRNYILPYADVIAWCLMPNHFHFMISPNNQAVQKAKEIHLSNTQVLSKQFGTLLSSYTKAFNKQNNRIGSLFAHNTKAKQLNNYTKPLKIASQLSKLPQDYTTSCFRYIHNNPVKSELVENIRDWEFSSYNDFAGKRTGTIINRELAMETVNYDNDNFYAWSMIELKDDDIKNIF